jgi:type III secretion system chaperone SycN
MGMVEDTINEFGNTMGIEDLQFNQNGTIVLSIENIGTLCIEKSNVEKFPEIILCMIRAYPQHDDEISRKALAACHYDKGHPFPVSAGVKGTDMLAFMARIPEKQFTIPAIEQCIPWLARMFDEIGVQ